MDAWFKGPTYTTGVDKRTDEALICLELGCTWTELQEQPEWWVQRALKARDKQREHRPNPLGL